MDERVGVNEMQDRNQGHQEDGDGGSDGRPFDADIQCKDEDGIQNHVQDGTARHDEHGFHRITRGADQTGEVEGNGNQEHTW